MSKRHKLTATYGIQMEIFLRENISLEGRGLKRGNKLSENLRY